MNNKVVVNILIITIISLVILVGAKIDNNEAQILTAEMSLINEPLQIAEINELNLTTENQIDTNEDKIQVISIRQFVEEEIIKDSENEIYENLEEYEKIKIPRKLDLTSRGGHTRNISVVKPVEEIAKEVYNGLYGNGEERKENLKRLGYNYEEVQKEVDKIVSKNSSANNNTKIANSLQGSQVIPAYPHSTFKSYMAWTALSKNSPQGKLCAKATKDNNTAIMMYEGRYLVALGKAYANYIGEKIDVVMENGQVIPVIVGDFKAIAHTDQYNSATLHDGSIIEFIVSSNKEASKAVQGSGSYNGIFPGKVKEFIKK